MPDTKPAADIVNHSRRDRTCGR